VSLYGQARDWPAAEEAYRAALSLGLDSADAHYDYGVVLGAQQRWEDAEAAYRAALRSNPLHAPARNNLGQALERRRAFEDAAAEYRRAIEAQPTFRLARFNLGRMLLALGTSPEAVVEFEQLQEPRDAETPRYLFGLATAYVRTGRRDDAVRVAAGARTLALEFGQAELAAAIERELAALK
jgi:tetratricopeptide (TPR) repeat protein